MEIDIKPQLFQDWLSLLKHALARDKWAYAWLTHRKEICQYIEIGEEAQFLRDDCDPMSSRIGSAGKMNLLAIEAQHPRIRKGSPDQHLDQRRFARAILSYERMHRADTHTKIHPFERDNSAISFA